MRAKSVLATVLLLCACSDDSAPLTINDVAVARPKPGMQITAGYFTITNHTPREIVITEVSSPQFGSVQMHETVIDDGIARMVELDKLLLQAGSTVDFQPGGKHLMLMQAAENLDEVTLEFFAGESMILSIDVKVTD